MTVDDERNIARALVRQEQGLALDSHDLWLLRAYERRQRREQHDVALTDAEAAQAQIEQVACGVIDDWLLPAVEVLAEESGRSVGELERRISQLERELAELKATRPLDDDRTKVIDLPQIAWRRGNAA